LSLAVAAADGYDSPDPIEEQQRAGSVLDRLRNATALCVRQVHALLGDPSVVGEEAPNTVREQYYRELDRQCIELWRKTKVWLGGRAYAQNKRCVANGSCIEMHACVCGALPRC
jgi:hypothetical protein